MAVLVMLILVSFGVGVVLMFSTSSLQVTGYNIRQRSTGLAEAGFRYAAGEYRSAGNLANKFNRLAALNGEDVTLLNNDGSFQLNVFPYWFVTSAAVTNSTGMTLSVLGKFPQGFQADLPAAGMVKINTSFYNYTGGTPANGSGHNPDQFTLTLNNPVTIPVNTSVQLAYAPPSTQTVNLNGSFTIAPNNLLMNIFPQKNGLIEIFENPTESIGTYRYRQRNTGATVILDGITPVEDDHLPFLITTNSRIVIKKQAFINSTGSLGAGNFASSRDLGLNVFLTDEMEIPADSPNPLPLGDGPGEQEDFNDEEGGDTQLENWEFDEDDPAAEDEKLTVTTQEIETEFGHEWNSSNYVTFQNFTAVFPDRGYTAELVDRDRLPEAVRNNNLNGVWGNASDNIYFVGDDGTIIHYDGTDYSTMASNTTEDLNAIWGIPFVKNNPSDTENIFVVGDNGEALINEEGDGWEHSTHRENHDIHAAWGTSWGHFDGYGEAGTNPYNWDSPNSADRLANYPWYIREFGGHVNFRSLWAILHRYPFGTVTPYQNIIVGEFAGGHNDGNGIIMHEFHEPVIIPDSPLRGIWGSDFANIYAVGDSGAIYQNTSGNTPEFGRRPWPNWNNSWQGSWRRIPAGLVPTTANLNGVYGNNANDFYVIGDDGTILYNKGDGFELVPTADITTETLNSIWGSDQTGIYAVGNNGTIVFLGYPSNEISGHILPLSKNSEISEKWENTNRYLSYSIQVKTVWGDDLDYGASGICFRWHQPEPGLYAGYGISFIRYDGSQNDYNDLIPNSIKPDFNTGQEKDNRLLLVLWEQYVQGGGEQRRWLAYKDITDDTTARKASNRTPRDLASLFVRVHEKRIEGQKVNDIDVYYGNASLSNQASDNRYNNTRRNEYNPTFGTNSGSIKWPVFGLDNWTMCPSGPDGISCDDADSFTLVDNVSVATTPVRATASIKYWIINTEADQVVLRNNFTIRATRFTSPDSSDFGSQSDRSEIGLHVFGNIGDSGSQSIVSFAEFAVQLGVDADGVDSESSFGSLQ